MPLLTIRHDADRSFLTRFSLGWIAFFGLVGALRAFRHGDWTTAVVLWTIGGVLGVAGLVRPAVARGLYLAWMTVLSPVAWVVSVLLLSLVYLLVVTPIGLIRRRGNRDPLGLRPEPDAETYWIDRTPSDDVRRYFRQH